MRPRATDPHRAHTITPICRRVRSEYNKTGVRPHRHRRIPAAPTTNAADYYTEEEPPRFSEFSSGKDRLYRNYRLARRDRI
ncbi:MAG: hypothetical protein ACLTYW_10765 [Collinsella sp.]